MKISQLKNKYQGKAIEDYGAYMSPSAKTFVSGFRATIKEICNDTGATLISCKAGHYYLSGFIKKDNNYVYFSREIERYNRPINLDSSDPMNGILIRSAKDTNDYSGGRNNFTGIDDFKPVMKALLNKPLF